MKRIPILSIAFLCIFCLSFKLMQYQQETESFIYQTINQSKMNLGGFSLSLSVKDLGTSKTFYENLGFVEYAGSMEQKYLIMKGENVNIGLFQDMFEGNIMTFNPGWDASAKNVDPFTDVREIEQHVKSKGIALVNEVGESTEGPGSIMIQDPDGNMILFDQHR